MYKNGFCHRLYWVSWLKRCKAFGFFQLVKKFIVTAYHTAPVQMLVDVLQRSFGERPCGSGQKIFQMVKKVIFSFIEYRSMQKWVVQSLRYQLEVVQAGRKQRVEAEVDRFHDG